MPINRKFRKFVDTKYLSDDAVTTAKIEALAVGTADIANDAITNAKTDDVQKKYLRFKYDFAELGGAIGAITLTDEDDAVQVLPDNAVITGISIEGVTDNTSGGSATVALGYVTQATAFLAATAFDNAMWNVDAVTTGTPTVAVAKMATPAALIATVATAALTAGKWYVWVEYYEGA